MCFICMDIKDGLLSEYDADILAVELAPFIGFEHSEAIRKALKKAREPIKLELDTPDYGFSFVYPGDND